MTRKEIERISDNCKALGLTLEEGLTLSRLSENLRKIGERRCNGYYSEQSRKWNETHEDSICREISKIADKHGMYFYHQCDPRGYQVYIIKLSASFLKCWDKYYKEHPDCDDFNYFLSLNYSRFGYVF